MSTQTVAVSGLGSIGRQHVAAFRSSGVERILGFDASDEMCEATNRAGLRVEFVDTYSELLDRGPDAVVIAVPDHAHLEQLSQAVERDITALVEKPIGPSYADSVSTVRRLQPHGDRSLVGYVVRHKRAARQVAALLEGGAIGEPTSFQVMLGAYGTITAAASRFAKPEYGRLFRDYSHEWDYLNWYFGRIVRVFAIERTTESVPHVERPNLVDGLLETERGIVGAVHIDYVDRRGIRMLTIIGTDGSISANLGDGTIEVRRAGASFIEQYNQAENAHEALVRQAEHLLAIARGEAQPIVTLADGLAALSVADAMVASATAHGWVDCEI